MCWYILNYVNKCQGGPKIYMLSCLSLLKKDDGTGKSLSEALVFGEPRENMLCRYINCSECQNQFLYTTCSPHVLSLAFSCIELVVILWVSWCKNKSFWQRFTCMHNACRIVDSMQTFYGGRPLYVLGIRWLLARLIQFDLQ